MTESELQAVIRGLAPVIRELVTKAAELHTTTLHDRLVTIERRLVDDLMTKDVGQLRERVATLEARAPLPGPPGQDGRDGLGFDDLEAVQTDERTIEMQLRRGEQTKTVGRLTFPVDLYQGVYVDGKAYEPGDNVTYQGSVWHCNEATREGPPNGGKAWTLKVKRGRDGKVPTP